MSEHQITWHTSSAELEMAAESAAMAIDEKMSELWPTISAELDEIISGSSSKKQRLRRLRKVVDVVSEVVAPHTPCAASCNYCCHLAVTISQTEANVIAEELAVHAKQLPAATRMGGQQWAGTACPFLSSSGLCAVYEVRPIACRSYFSLAPNSEPCEAPISEQRIPSPNLSEIQKAYLMMISTDSLADIRDFFGVPLPLSDD